MQNLNKLPSESISSRLNGHKNSAPDNAAELIAPPLPEIEQGEGADLFGENGHDTNVEPGFLRDLNANALALSRSGESVVSQPATLHTMPRRGRSLRMQYRFWRTLVFAGRLFASLLWWHFVMPRVVGEER